MDVETFGLSDRMAINKNVLTINGVMTRLKKKEVLLIYLQLKVKTVAQWYDDKEVF